MGLPNRKAVFQASLFRGYVSFREGMGILWEFFHVTHVGILGRDSPRIFFARETTCQTRGNFPHICLLPFPGTWDEFLHERDDVSVC